MNKIQFDNLLKPLVNIIDSIELDLISDVIARVDNYKDIKGTLKWYLDKLGESGILDKETSKLLKSNKSQIKKILTEIMENAGHNTDNLDLLNKYYEKGLINTDPVEIYNSQSINNIINNALKDSTSIMDLIETKAIEGASSMYKDILNKAYIETASGVYTYTEAIRRALNSYGEKGIQTISYESGRTLSIEAAVRREVITRTNKLVGDIELQRAKDMGTNLVYVDQHLGARTRTKYTKHDYEAHCEWQGKKYMLDGSSDKYPNFYEKTGYGEMLGLKGINCYHNFRPTWEWEKIEPVIEEKANAEMYEKYETQRLYERKIRKNKREQIVSKSIGDTDKYKKLKAKGKTLNSEYNDWLEENDMRRDYSREYVAKIKSNGLSANEKYTLENHPKPTLIGNINIHNDGAVNNLIKSLEKQIRDDRIENAIVITQNGEIYQCYGNESNVWPDIDLGDKLVNAYVTHNHPKEETNYSFSPNDIALFEKYNLSILRGTDEKHTYELDRMGKPTLSMPKFGDVIEDNSLYHIQAIDYAIKHNISYKRWKNDKRTN